MSQAAVDPLPALRRALASIGGEGVASSDLFPLGLPSLDTALSGGLARAALHEVHAPLGLADAASAGGFALALGLRATARGRPILWVRPDFVETETGGLSGEGLSALGLDPSRLLLVRPRDPAGVLRAMADAARCSAVGTVVGEIWGEPRELDLQASRRLVLFAARAGVTRVLVRLGARLAPSAASSRWTVSAAPSRALEADAPGRAAWSASLVKHRIGSACRTWLLEWDHECCVFCEPAPLSRPVVSVSPRRQGDAGASIVPVEALEWRKAG